MIQLLFRIILTILAYFIGDYIGSTYKTNSEDCIVISGYNHKIQNVKHEHTSSSLSEPAHVHIITEESVLTHVFNMIHHPTSAVKAEAIVTSNSNWNSKLSSSCSKVLVDRSPVRVDQANRCVVIARVHNDKQNNLTYKSLTNINHRLGEMTWPQVLTDQYQVCILKLLD